MKLRQIALALAGTALVLQAGAAHADATLDRIRERGRIIVGITVNGSPFGSLDPTTHQPVGFNPSLAREVAKELGVKLETVEVIPATRVQFLQQGKVDILIASMDLTKDRAEILDYAPTPYYRVGGIGVVSKKSGLNTWEDLRGKVVCVSQGSNYAAPLAQTYGANVKGLRGTAESLLALRGGTCDASVHDSVGIWPILRKNQEYADYKAITPELIPSPSVIWARKGEKDTVQALDRIVQGWHKRGWLIQTERDSHVEPPSPVLVELHDKFKDAAL